MVAGRRQRRNAQPRTKGAQKGQRVQAAVLAQGALVGTMAACQLFLDGTGRMLPGAGGALWWAALLCPIGALLLVLPISRMRRDAGGQELFSIAMDVLPYPVAAALCALCALTLLSDAAVAMQGLTELAHASLLPGGDPFTITVLTLLALLLSAYAGLTGMQRLSYLLRLALPVLLFACAAWTLWGRPVENLLPLAGYGMTQSLSLGLGSLGAAACTLGLGFLPGGVRECPTVDARENCAFALSGHMLAVLLLLGFSLSTPYGLWQLVGGWGQRMILHGHAALYNGILYRFMTVLELTVMLLGAGGALLFSAHAASRITREPHDRVAFTVVFALLCAAMGIGRFAGMDWLFAVMPWRYAAALAVVWIPFLAQRVARKKRMKGESA